MYKIILYIVSILLSVFAYSGLNIDHLFKTNHIWEARILVIIISIITGYLFANFLIDFLEASTIM